MVNAPRSFSQSQAIPMSRCMSRHAWATSGVVKSWGGAGTSPTAVRYIRASTTSGHGSCDGPRCGTQPSGRATPGMTPRSDARGSPAATPADPEPEGEEEDILKTGYALDAARTRRLAAAATTTQRRAVPRPGCPLGPAENLGSKSTMGNQDKWGPSRTAGSHARPLAPVSRSGQRYGKGHPAPGEQVGQPLLRHPADGSSPSRLGGQEPGRFRLGRELCRITRPEWPQNGNRRATSRRG